MVNDLTDWLAATDEHAAHHLALLSRAEAELQSAAVPPVERAELAQKIDRWRSLHLNEHGGRLQFRFGA